MRYHHRPVIIAVIKKARNKKCWWGCGDKGTLLYCCLEYKLVQPLWKTVWRFHKKVRIELPYDLAILLLGIYTKNMKTLIWKDICTRLFMAALFTIAKIWKQPKCPSLDEWIKKMWLLYTYIEEWNLAICKNMDGLWGHCAKWNKSDRERQIPYDLTCEI